MKVSISVNELQKLLHTTSMLLVIDVRDAVEFKSKRLPFTGNMPLSDIVGGNYIPDNGKTIITVCNKGGGRSEKAANYLRENFVNPVYYLEGGLEAWFQLTSYLESR